MKGILKKITIGVGVIVLTTSLYAKDLKLVDYYFIDSQDKIEPSGLCIKNEKLFFVSDNADDTIYSIKFNGKNAIAVPEIKFKLPKKKEKQKYNFEGIVTDNKGNFVVIGEKSLSLVIVNEKGEAQATKSFKKEALKENMFKNRSEGPEGVCITDDGDVVIASQNDHGKLMIANIIDNDFENVETKKIKSKEIKEGKGKEKSISDLNYFKGNIYALLKNQNTVIKLKYEGKNFVEEETYEFENAVNGSDFLYLIGNSLGEGVAVDDKYIYVVFDNNNQPRLANINDTRPLLLKFEKP